jgi:hypothetical protein
MFSDLECDMMSPIEMCGKVNPVRARCRRPLSP